jgi:hypothetical protein
MTPRRITQRESDTQTQLAVARYGILMSYLAYENTMFWQRSGFFLAGNGALIAFGVSRVELDSARIRDVAIPVSLAVGGLMLTWIWRRALTGAAVWIDHWHSTLDQFEAGAFGNIEVLTPEVRARVGRKAPMKRLAVHVTTLFSLGWCVMLIGPLALLALNRTAG